MIRLDKALVDQGLARGRGEAKELIASGGVAIDGSPARKTSQLVDDTMRIEVTASGPRYVSRGGLKLSGALTTFHVDPAGKLCLDIGASTGGFSDCLLQLGADRIVAVDVGHGQMVESIANDGRVELREGINARYLKPDDFQASFDLIVVDISFISLTLVLPALSPLLAEGGDLICLVKPQFEVGANKIGKGGIVKSHALRQSALDGVIESASKAGLVENGRMVSPIEGGDGNKEVLVWFRG
jgi:23S rRNA (cytidine1920-2'-O)/16S rRNA (cytidine1409-2'-O)-methyltransferase